MKPEKRYFIILAWFAVLTAGGLLLFTKGFLLKRLIVEEISSCHVNFTSKTDQHGQDAEGCWMHKRFKRAVIIIVDALRYDFAAYQSSVKSGTELPYQNKLKVFRELLRKKSDQTRLYKFIADPPTTTLQRLKGLTTGSLPTFVDAGSNFASSEITEDNYIDQLIKANKSITFMGDDTWMGLFPDRFKKAYAFPSLNVKDLHTVDDGVIEHLVPEMKTKGWDVLIAHFLGVDHCGHRYGPNHPAMAEKLTQMDKVIRSVVKQLKDDTVLVVMGDHGMTRTGDHGGDSQDELEAALFIHSPSRITSMPPQKGRHKSVFQVDFVPTLSLLLGVPIPFSNLGSIITDLFTYCPWWKTDSNKIQQKYHAVKALRLNAHQVHEYLMSYSLVSDEFPYIELAELDFSFRRCETQLQEMLTLLQIDGDDENLQDNLEHLHEEYINFLMDSRNMCQRIWAKFDHPNMLLGGLSTVISVVVMAYIVVVIDPDWDACCAKVYAAVVGSGWVVVFFAFLYMVGLGTTGLIASISLGLPAIGISTFIVSKVLTSSFKQSEKDRPPSPQGDKETEDLPYDYTSFLSSNFSSLCMMLYAGALFSNSFVVFEDALVSFLIPTILCVLFYQMSRDLAKTHLVDDRSFSAASSKKTRFDIMRFITSPRCLLFLAMALLNLCIRLAYIFRGCREEQWTCEISQFLLPLSSLTNDLAGYKNIRYFFSVIAMVSIPAAVHKWLRYHGNLNGFAPAVMITLYAVPVCSVCMCLYWALQGLPENLLNSMPVWQIVSLPRIVYILSALSLVVVVIKPLCIYVYERPSEQDLVLPELGSVNPIPQLYNHLKLHWKNASGDNKEKPIPVVYGLATAYSSALIVVLTLVTQVVALLLGDGVAPSVTLQMGAMFLLLEVHAAYVTSQDQGSNHNLDVPWSSIVLWGLIASNFFFSTGHQAAITTIRWEAAYVGFHGDFQNYAIPAILITLNTFAGPLLSTVGLPLLLFWPAVRERMLCVYSRCRQHEGLRDDSQKRGELGLHERHQYLCATLFRLFLGYLLYHGIKLIGAMGAATLHQRHLMVWKIFAPRFVLEGATWLFISFVSLLSFLVVIRINRVLQRWAEGIEESQTKS